MKKFPALIIILFLIATATAIFALVENTQSKNSQSYTLTPCPFAIPKGKTAKCGFLTVPLDHQSNQSSTIKLFVYKLIAKNSLPKQSPIINIVGGPGVNSFLLMKDNTWWDLMSPYLESHDMIMMDPRGAGRSQPQLNCLGLDPNQPPDKAIKKAQACKTTLANQGIKNLSLFNSQQSAQDILTLVKALNLNSWDVLATSYGARVAMELLTYQPKGLRAIILNSPETGNDNRFSAEKVENIRRVFTLFFKTHPAVEKKYLTLIAHLKSNPTVSNKLKENIIAIFTNTSDIDNLPQYINQSHTSASKNKLTLKKLDAIFKTSPKKANPNIPYGLVTSVICREDYNTANVNKYLTAVKNNSAYYSTREYRFYQAVCPIWKVGTPSRSFNPSLSENNTPALILTGNYDAALAPAWAKQIHREMPKSYFYEFSGVGHSVLYTSACAIKMAVTFLNNPNIPPVLPCYRN